MANKAIRSARTGRKVRRSMETICIYVTSELATALRVAAEYERRTVSEVARFILEAKLLKEKA